MGIKGLLPLLKDITFDININSYKGQKVGIDGYVWLHQKAYPCATDICLGKPTHGYVYGFIKEVHVLLRHGVIPVVVFDGTYLPQKAKVEHERAKARENNLELGKKLYDEGETDKAFQAFAKAINITPHMAFQVIQQLKQLNVEYYVAPYEADAQLAYLVRIGHIVAVISIDSDLLPFGAKTLLTKYNNGWVKEVSISRLNETFEPLDFSQFSFEMFVQFCIFCGCDYLNSIPGIGPKTAHQYMLKGKQWLRTLKCIQFDGKYRVPKEYKDGFQRALYTFRHQRVYDPIQKRLVHLQPLPSDRPDLVVNLDFLGPDMDPNTAQQIAAGVIDPISKALLVSQSLPHQIQWRHAERKQKKKQKKTQSNTILSYIIKHDIKRESTYTTQCVSPPPPAVLFEKSFERNKESIQLISDNLELLKKQNNPNYVSLDSFAFDNRRKHKHKHKHRQVMVEDHLDDDESGDNLDATMSKFAFKSRKRRRELLPSKPIKYEETKHEFRPPSKKRRLNDFESPFIPKESGSFALCSNTSSMPQYYRKNEHKTETESNDEYIPETPEPEPELPDAILIDSDLSTNEMEDHAFSNEDAYDSLQLTQDDDILGIDNVLCSPRLENDKHCMDLSDDDDDVDNDILSQHIELKINDEDTSLNELDDNCLLQLDDYNHKQSPKLENDKHCMDLNNDDLSDDDDVNNDILSQHIELKINDEDTSLNELDDCLLYNTLQFDDDLNINTLPMDVVLRNPVEAVLTGNTNNVSSLYRRHRNRLRLHNVEDDMDIGSLGENDYF